MSRWRRGAGVAALGLGIAVALGSAPSAAQSGSGWSVVWDDPDFVWPSPSATAAGTVSYTYTLEPGEPPVVEIIDEDSFELSFDAPADLPDGCDVPGPLAPETARDEPAPPTTPTTPPTTTPTTGPGEPEPVRDVVEFRADDVDFPCNGTYVVTITGSADAAVVEPSSFSDSSVILVATPPSPIGGVTATFDSTARSVTLGWNAYATTSPGLPPGEFLGYRVDRALGLNNFQPLAATNGVTTTATTFTDTSMPRDGQVYYRVLAVRRGATAPVASAGGTIKGPFALAAPPATSTSTTIRPPATPRRVTAVGPRTTDTLDTGYDPTLDYEPGEDDPVLPDDEFAQGSVIQRFIDGERGGRAIAVPVAGGLVLIGWAMHIRFLTRQARQPL